MVEYIDNDFIIDIVDGPFKINNKSKNNNFLSCEETVSTAQPTHVNRKDLLNISENSIGYSSIESDLEFSPTGKHFFFITVNTLS